MTHEHILTIGLAKETESPENPKGLDKRTALIPKDIEILVQKGCTVFFETGAGERLGFSDNAYTRVGAKPQNSADLYSEKDMIIKLKGPSLENIRRMRPGSILFCMAHFRSFADRAKLLQVRRINVIAMEEIVQSPKHISDEIILGKRMASEAMNAQNIPIEKLQIGFLGCQSGLVGGIRRAGNRSIKSLTVYQDTCEPTDLLFYGEQALYFFDSRHFKNNLLLTFLRDKGCQLIDLEEYIENRGSSVIQEYRESHPPFQFGSRIIQCLHETGIAGARYGFHLLKNISSKRKLAKDATVIVLGYGNVAMGAIFEAYAHGAKKIHVLNKKHTRPKNIVPYLQKSDLIINGAEQAPKLRGKNYLVTSEHVKSLIPKGSVIIDLIGGSPTNRSPIEDVLHCTFLTEPYFEKHGIFISALWGWPMMGMMRESTMKYSRQIVDILVGPENLLAGLDTLTPGVQKALVCGPH
jgi:alanine dehydrogenase